MDFLRNRSWIKKPRTNLQEWKLWLRFSVAKLISFHWLSFLLFVVCFSLFLVFRFCCPSHPSYYTQRVRPLALTTMKVRPCSHSYTSFSPLLHRCCAVVLWYKYSPAGFGSQVVAEFSLLSAPPLRASLLLCLCLRLLGFSALAVYAQPEWLCMTLGMLMRRLSLARTGTAWGNTTLMVEQKSQETQQKSYEVMMRNKEGSSRVELDELSTLLSILSFSLIHVITLIAVSLFYQLVWCPSSVLAQLHHSQICILVTPFTVVWSGPQCRRSQWAAKNNKLLPCCVCVPYSRVLFTGCCVV